MLCVKEGGQEGQGQEATNPCWYRWPTCPKRTARKWAGDWKPAPPVPGRGASSFPPPTQLQDWRFGGGRAAGRLRPGAVRRKRRPGLFWSLKAAEGREQPAPALCEPRSPLARLGPPRRAFLASAAGAGPPAVRQVVTGQRGLELHVHSFIYASIRY